MRVNSSWSGERPVSRFPKPGALIRVSLARHLLVLLVTMTLHSACTESIEVLTTADAGKGWTDCAEALKAGRQGEPCSGFRGCVTRSDDGCCSRVVECALGVLDIQESCLRDCPGPCADDSQCLFGREWCTESKCTPCPQPPEGCFDNCPRGWKPSLRNGCYTCDCVPPSQCHQDTECPAGFVCYGGVSCPAGCKPGDARCCEGNFCGPPGCALPSPTGCMTVGCPTGFTCVVRGCTPSYCRCDTASGAWLCTTDCEGGVCVLVQ
jgi:hypothetical protein